MVVGEKEAAVETIRLGFLCSDRMDNRDCSASGVAGRSLNAAHHGEAILQSGFLVEASDNSWLWPEVQLFIVIGIP